VGHLRLELSCVQVKKVLQTWKLKFWRISIIIQPIRKETDNRILKIGHNMILGTWPQVMPIRNTKRTKKWLASLMNNRISTWQRHCKNDFKKNPSTQEKRMLKGTPYWREDCSITLRQSSLKWYQWYEIFLASLSLYTEWSKSSRTEFFKNWRHITIFKFKITSTGTYMGFCAVIQFLKNCKTLLFLDLL
jgi:hypothetical protein